MNRGDRSTGMEKASVNIEGVTQCVVSGKKDFHGLPAGMRSTELPKESAAEFSSTPFDFEDSAKSLWEDTQLTYYHACTENRFSENYLDLCGRLEKNIRRMGSICLTKTVLEQKNMSFPELADLNVTELVRMVSFHFRKAHAAFRGIYQDNNFFGMSYLNWEFRWFSLGTQLKATEVKIQKIRDGELNADELLRQEQACRQEKHSHEHEGQLISRSLPVNASALPLDGSLAKKMLEAEQEAEKQEMRERKICERESREITRELMKCGIFPDMFPFEGPDQYPVEQELLPEEGSEIYSSAGEEGTCIDINEESLLFENVSDRNEPRQSPDPPSKFPKHRKKKRWR